MALKWKYCCLGGGREAKHCGGREAQTGSMDSGEDIDRISHRCMAMRSLKGDGWPRELRGEVEGNSLTK